MLSPILKGVLVTLLAVITYGLVHSLLASPHVKAFAQKRFGQGFERSYRITYNFIGLLTLLPVLAVPIAYPGIELYRLSYPWMSFAIAGQAIALFTLLIGLLQTDIWEFLGLSQLLQAQGGRDGELQVQGLYRWVRHPLYTAGLIFIWLIPVMTTSLVALNIALTLYIYIGSHFEEQRLIDEFGEVYEEYRRCVPRLIPRPWRRAPGCD
jgi:protein-S-isoprenylcysteine O-methyltransferase Ste14